MTGKIFLPFFAFLLGFAVVFCCQNSAVGDSLFTSADLISASGTHLVNGNGEPVQLRGFNLGGWLLKTPAMSPVAGTNVDDDTDVGSVLESRFGSTVAGQLQDTFLDNYITSADFDTIAATGANVVRLPFWWRNFMDANGDLILNAQSEPDFSVLDNAVAECAARGIYVILDLHGAPGSQNGAAYSGLETAAPTFFAQNATGEENRAIALDLWEAVADHFADEPAIAGYDILNEPYWTGTIGPDERWWIWEFYDDAYNTIRSVDSDHLIILESCWGVESLPDPSSTAEDWKDSAWTNVAYSDHYYPRSWE